MASERAVSERSGGLQPDYLIVGAGAMGMAFADVLLTETDATMVIVDRHGRPGGHWNDSYPHVRLHQPSAFYGVNSREMGSGKIDQVGSNAGLSELASGTEVVTYFDQVMQQQFLPSGRVDYFPMCEYAGDGRVVSLVSGDEQHIAAGKVVDATYMNVTVPSMHPPSYEIAEGVTCIAPNELGRVTAPPDGYTVVGAGKTAMDACLWLLSNQVNQADITWIMPRDSWLLDRANIQPAAEFSSTVVESIARQTEITAAASTIEELFDGLEAGGMLLRLDPSVRPTMYRCATVTTTELDQLRQIETVIRQGRVQRIDRDQIVLDEGVVATTPGTLHINCTADGLARRPVVPVFDGDKITLQAIRTCQQVFSAALLGHIEANYDDEAVKNELATVVPHPNSDIDWLRTTLTTNLNRARWNADAELAAWLGEARLDAMSAVSARAAGDPAMVPAVGRILEHAGPAVVRLQKLLADYDAQSVAQ